MKRILLMIAIAIVGVYFAQAATSCESGDRSCKSIFESQPGQVDIVQGKNGVTVVSNLLHPINISVYQGTKLVSYREIGPQSSTTFDLLSGNTYTIMVVGESYEGEFELEW